MKPIISLSRNILILCLCLVALTGLHCRRRSNRASEHESKITLLYMRDTEQSVFRDGAGTQSLMFIPLADMDEEGRQREPRLLERWKHSNDYTEWTFYLRKDVKWHDGKPVTAHDVKFTIELVTDPNVMMYGNPVFEEITIIDNFTCHIRSNRPFNPLELYTWNGIRPKHLLEGLDPAEFHSWEFWTRPVGIRMEIVTLDRSVLRTRGRSGEFDAILFNTYFGGYEWIMGGHDNLEVKQLIEAVDWIPTSDERDLAVRKLWPIFLTDMPLTFLSPQVWFNVVHRRIRGLKSPNRADLPRIMEHLWIEEEKD